MALRPSAVFDFFATPFGWRQHAVCFAAGASALFAFAPLYITAFLVPAFGVLALAAAGARTPARAFIAGWWWGAGFFAAGLYWVSMALLVEAEKFAWMIAPAIFLLAAGFGLFVALGALVTRMLSRGSLLAAPLVLAGSWTVLEWVRGWLFTGFPWNMVGSGWAGSEAAIQFAAIGGTLGLGTLTVLAASAPVALGAGGYRGRKAFAALALVIPAALFVFGEARLKDADDETVPGVQLRLVQANIAQKLKWRPDLLQSHMQTQMQMGAEPAGPDAPTPTHIIWGETQAPFYLGSSPAWLKALGRATPAGGLSITGTLRRTDGGGVANAMAAVDENGNVVATYDKFHLVPFGEYVPLADILPLEKITHGTGAFTPGPGLQTLNLPGLPPASPLICYEVIFPGEVALDEPRPAWLLNLTNDAWYGRTQGPHQHFALSQMRSVEEGLPLVRVANTGISGVVDAYGRIRAKTALGVAATLDAPLPVALDGRTVYSAYGNVVPLLMAVFLLLAGGWLGALRARHTGK